MAIEAGNHVGVAPVKELGTLCCGGGGLKSLDSLSGNHAPLMELCCVSGLTLRHTS